MESTSSSLPNKRPRLASQERKRATRACDRCRKLKEKCEGGEPCGRCVKSRRVCVFSAVGATGSGISSTAVTTTGQRTESSKPSDEKTKYLEQIAKHFLGDVSMTLPNLRRIAEKLELSRRTGSVTGNVVDEELDLADETFAVKSLSHNAAHYSGEFSHWNFSQKLRDRIDNSNSALGAKEQQEDEIVQVIEYWRASQLQSPTSTVREVLECLPPWDIVEFLAQVYFQYAQTNSFYAEERWIRAKISLLKSSRTIISTQDSGWVCSVLIVLAIGSQFSHMASEHNPYLETTTKPDIGVKFYQMACKLIPDIITIASLESVQACLLLAHYTLPLDTPGLAYTYLGLTLKIAIQNGMHRKYVGSEFNAHTVEVRNRLWWTAYSLDRRISVMHGRPTSISHNEIDVDLPQDLEEFETQGQPKAFVNMSAMIHLSTRLGEISHAISLLRKCPKTLQPHYLDELVSIQQQVRAWWNTLPASVTGNDDHISNDDITKDLNNTRSFRNTVHLKLCFHLNDIFMGRPFILLDPKSSSPKPHPNPSSSPHPKAPTIRSTLASDAVTAALSVLTLLQTLQDTIGLARASYTEFSSCRAALLVIIAQSFNERSAHLSSALKSGILLIRRMAVDIESAKSEVSVIESLELAVKKLDISASNTTDTSAPQVDSNSNSHSQYGRFKTWAAGITVEQSDPDTTLPDIIANESDIGTQLEDILDTNLSLPSDEFWEGWNDDTRWLDGVDFGMDWQI